MMGNDLLRGAAGGRGALRFAGLRPVQLAFGDVLYEAGAPIRHVYFPTRSIVSLLATRGQGTAPVEVGVVGREGMLGASIAAGIRVSPVHATVQRAGSCWRGTPAQFRGALGRNRALRDEVYRYSHELTAQVMQIAACNRNHSIEQRLARWLLMLRERALEDRIELTQRFVGAMLGVRRAGVNEAAGSLQARGLIRVRRGSVEILDARGMKAAACDCYEAMKLT